MNKLLLGSAFALLAGSALAASPVTINNAGNTDSAAITSHALNVTLAGGAGTNQNVNVAQVNGATVNVGTGAASTGTQRVTTSTDSTIGTVTAVTAITNALPAGTNLLGKAGIDQTTPGTTNGVVVTPCSATTCAITPVVSASAEGSHVLKGSAGNLYSVTVTTGTTAGYLMVFNATSAPGDGAVTPQICVVAPANNTTSVNFGAGPGEVYSTGITAVFSSTGCFTKTASATAFIHGSVF